MEKILILLKENLRLLIGIAVVIFIITVLVTLIINRKTPQATINDQTFKLMVAKTDKEKQIGLSEKRSIPNSQGMIFIFAKADFYTFWMKDMKFPIDIIYINNDTVTTIFKNAQIPSSPNESLPLYKSNAESDTVLEINAGLSDKYGIHEGSKVKIENL